MLIILLVILIFGILISVHEFGHFIVARAFGVGIKEFSIGFGPKLLRKTSRKSGTCYTLRLLPIGGYVNMVDEDGIASDDIIAGKTDSGIPVVGKSYASLGVFKRILILVAGGFFNILTGVVFFAVFVIIIRGSLGSTVIYDFTEDSLSAYVLRQNDKILEVNGKKVGISSDMAFRIAWEAVNVESVEITGENGEKILLENVALVDLTVLRDGEVIVLEDVPFASGESEGVSMAEMDFIVYRDATNLPNIVKHVFYQTKLSIDQVWAALGGMITGRVGFESMSGPIGVTDAINQTANSAGYRFVVYFAALIAVNVGIFNLLPIPALDGGKLFFLIIEAIRGKPVNPEIEARIHAVGMILLLFLAVFVAIQDVIGIFA